MSFLKTLQKYKIAEYTKRHLHWHSLLQSESLHVNVDNSDNGCTRTDCLGQCNIYSFVALTNAITASFAAVAIASVFAANFANVNEPLMFGYYDTQHNDIQQNDTQHKRAYL
jgi:hypothetical protein